MSENLLSLTSGDDWDDEYLIKAYNEALEMAKQGLQRNVSAEAAEEDENEEDDDANIDLDHNIEHADAFSDDRQDEVPLKRQKTADNEVDASGIAERSSGNVRRSESASTHTSTLRSTSTATSAAASGDNASAAATAMPAFASPPMPSASNSLAALLQSYYYAGYYAAMYEMHRHSLHESEEAETAAAPGSAPPVAQSATC